MKKVFLDTNVVVYFYTSTEPDKKRKSAELLLQYDCIISTQVLNELSNVLSKKYHFSWKEIASVHSELINVFDVHVVTSLTIAKAIAFAEKYGYSYYDSLILSAANETESSILYSEDFQNGQIIEGMKIVNPFL